MIKRKIKKAVQSTLEKIYNEEMDLKEVQMETPTDESHGDFSSNIAFKLAGKLKRDPKDIASEIADNLSGDIFESKSKGGFLNFYLTNSVLEDILKETLEFKTESKDKKMILDYSAPNIAKPFGIGHLRSTIVGQAIYNIYQFNGWKTIGVNHLGDWGTQYGKLLYQIIEKNLNPDNLSVDDLEKLYIDFHKEAENNPEMEKKAREWFKKLEDGDKKALKIWEKCVEVSLHEFNETYNLLDVNIDHVIGESFYQDKMDSVIAEAKRKGIAEESEGALIVDFNEEMPPAMIVKSNGGTTYLTRDLAAIKYRMENWKPELFIYEIGVDQKLHMRQLFKTAQLLGWVKDNRFKHVAHGMYRLKDGAMSTRKGRTIHLENVLEEAMKRTEEIIENSETSREMSKEEKKKTIEKVAVGAVKYADLKKHYKKDIIFDWNEILNLKGNSGPYLQYTTLRAKSVLDKCENFKFKLRDVSKKERKLVKKLTEFEDVVKIAEKNFTPSSIANFAYETAKEFNGFYSEFPILDADSENKKRTRISITLASFKILEKSLSLLGISIPERM